MQCCNVWADVCVCVCALQLDRVQYSFEMVFGDFDGKNGIFFLYI